MMMNHLDQIIGIPAFVAVYVFCFWGIFSSRTIAHARAIAERQTKTNFQ